MTRGSSACPSRPATCIKVRLFSMAATVQPAMAGAESAAVQKRPRISSERSSLACMPILLPVRPVLSGWPLRVQQHHCLEVAVQFTSPLCACCAPVVRAAT